MRRRVFIAALAAIGVAGALAVGLALAHFGIVRYPWLDRLGARRAQAAPRRILILGDSFLGEWPIRHCLAKDLLRYCADRRIGLMNAAVGGAGPREYLDQLETNGARFRPHLVLLFYYVGNDLTDVLYRTDPEPRREPGWKPGVLWPPDDPNAPAPTPAHWSASGQEQTTATEPVAAPKGPGNPTERDHGEFDWAAMRARGIPEELIAKAQARLREPTTYGPGRFVSPYFLELGLKAPRFLKDNLLIDTPEALAAWGVVEDKLDAIVRRCRDLDAELRIIAIPNTLQVDRSHEAFFQNLALEMDERFFNGARPQELLREFCARRGVPFVDLLPAFKARPSPPFTYFWPEDDHFSEAGHELAFDAVREQILEPWMESR